MVSPMPTVRLSNGLIVGNFSSGHPFTFTDGRVLLACETDRVELGSAQLTEMITVTRFHTGSGYVDVQDLKLQPTLRPECVGMLRATERTGAHIVIVPLMLKQAIDASTFRTIDHIRPMIRVIRRAERATKESPHPPIHIDRFCV